MSKKINKDQLEKVFGGGNGGGLTLTCPSPTCGKTFDASKATVKCGTIYCPYCGAYYGQFSD